MLLLTYCPAAIPASAAVAILLDANALLMRRFNIRHSGMSDLYIDLDNDLMQKSNRKQRRAVAEGRPAVYQDFPQPSQCRRACLVRKPFARARLLAHSTPQAVDPRK